MRTICNLALHIVSKQLNRQTPLNEIVPVKYYQIQRKIHHNINVKNATKRAYVIVPVSLVFF